MWRRRARRRFEEEEAETQEAHAAEAAGAQATREGRLPLRATRTLLAGCACPRCAVALAALGDDASPDDAPGEQGERDAPQHAGALTRALAAGLRINAARLAQFDLTLGAALTALHQQAERMAGSARVEQVAATREAAQAEQVVEELRARVARLEAQPVAGGPAARAVEKTLGGAALPAAGGLGAHEPGAEFRALEALAGRLRDPQAQLAVAAEMIRLQQRGGGE